ncbi:Protein of unknown function [Bacillus cytotoxicus]|nr:Protein of unknown function [Bacillus cytotoxicus]
MWIRMPWWLVAGGFGKYLYKN